MCKQVSELFQENPLAQLKPKRKYFFGTFNINSLVKFRKLKELMNILDNQKSLILALHEMKYTDNKTIEN